MSDSKSLSSREVLIQACLIALILVLFLLAATLVLKKYHKLFPLPPQSQEHGEYTEEYQAVEQPDPTSAIQPNTGKKGDTKTQEKKEALEKSFINRKRDLNAQEGMWRAANYLAVLAFLQLFITCITAIYLYRTFRVQKDELDTTKQASTLQLRPYSVSYTHLTLPTNREV